MSRSIAAAVALAGVFAGSAGAYPLDASEDTGITRLEAYFLAREGLLARGTLPPGAFRSSSDVRLRLVDQPDFRIPPPDAEFTAQLRALLGADAAAYAVDVLDLTDPKHPRHAEINGSMGQNPGSVGKLMVMLAWFQTLADVYPDDVAARKRVLHDSMVTANGFVRTDTHTVPFWKPGDERVEWRPLAEGDRANLWTFFDWMASASSNAAASMVMSQLVLLKHFGRDYPVSDDAAVGFFANTPKKKLTQILLDALETPIERNGLELSRLRQGSFFTREGKSRVPGTSSIATSHELLHYLVRMEQGKLVDPWSSLEIKRLIYLTDKRIRYAAQPALDAAAVYYKSGSLYSCKPEKGFECKKYRGNVLNFLNSVAVIETDQANGSLNYMVTVLSNVLRKDSSEAHQALAKDLHELIHASHGLTAGASPEAQ